MPKPKPSTISRDPYADDPYAFIGAPVRKEPKPEPTSVPRHDPRPVGKSATEKITTPYPVELIERARNAAYWERATLSGILVQALADVLDRMEGERGEPYPPRTHELRGGRPVGPGKTRNAGNT